LDIIGRSEAFSEHRFQVSGVGFQAGSGLFTTYMKLHGIQCHFYEVPHAVTEYRLRPRPSSPFVQYKILISRTRTKRIRLNRMHTPCTLNFLPCKSYKLQFFFWFDRPFFCPAAGLSPDPYVLFRLCAMRPSSHLLTFAFFPTSAFRLPNSCTFSPSVLSPQHSVLLFPSSEALR
jgi:hypothetical protein